MAASTALLATKLCVPPLLWSSVHAIAPVIKIQQFIVERCRKHALIVNHDFHLVLSLDPSTIEIIPAWLNGQVIQGSVSLIAQYHHAARLPVVRRQLHYYERLVRAIREHAKNALGGASELIAGNSINVVGGEAILADERRKGLWFGAAFNRTARGQSRQSSRRR